MDDRPEMPVFHPEKKDICKLVSYSTFVGNEKKTLTQIIAYCARVSNPSNQEFTTMEKDEKLISYLIKNNHWSPFEMINICLEIETTRDIARQILRHRSFSFQEFSQRYADYSSLTKENEKKFIIRDARLQDTENRQNSVEITQYNDEYLIKKQWELEQEKVAFLAEDVYKWAIENGIAKEQARVVLPEGMTKSRLYMNGTLRSWIHYIQLRSGNGTQKEHKIVAIECANVISTIFPMILDYVEIPTWYSNQQIENNYIKIAK